MQDGILFLYGILIVLSVFPIEKRTNDYLCAEYTTCMRGIAAVGIVLHHMSERTSDGVLFRQLGVIGYLLVTFFFFLSGYGLVTQYKSKNNYLDSFVRKRVTYLIIIYVLDVLLYTCAGTVMGERYTIQQIVYSLFFSGIAKNAWYMIIQILFYFSFFFIFRSKIIPTTQTKIIAVFLFQCAFCLICIVRQTSPMWYISSFGFSLGMLWAEKKIKIDNVLAKQYASCLFIVVCAFLISYCTPVLTDRIDLNGYNELIRHICRLISSPLSVASLLVMLYKLKPQMRMWSQLGKISLEIYLIHGLIYTILRSNYIYVNSDSMWTLLTLLISVALAFPIHKLNERIAVVLK